jgi:proteasome lid subunit RPN8/RPN11
MHLSKEIKQEIKSHAVEEHPKECCGLIVYDAAKTAFRLCKCDNSSSDKDKHFEISPSDYLRASLTGKIIAMYHSHPDSKESFSEFDKYQSNGHKVESVLYIMDSDNFEIYKPEDSRDFSWTREFKMKKSDCLTIIYDFYQEELGIDVSNWTNDVPTKLKKMIDIRDDNFGKIPSQQIEHEKILDEFKKRAISHNKETGEYVFSSIAGVVPACGYPFEDGKTCPMCKNGKCGGIQKYDLLSFNLFGYLFHTGIYLGNDTMLHHPPKGYPRIEKIKNFWKKRSNSASRHESLIKNE